MSKKIMLINATDQEEIRVAVLKDGVLSDFDIEFIHNEKIKGNIYKAKVIRVDASLQAAFVHYGGQKNGFLPIAELPKGMASLGGRRGRIQDLLQKGQEIIVQVVREELGTKGAMVTAHISLPGRYLVLTPSNAINGISRKIENQDEREHFKELVDNLNVPKGMGVIVRTASLGVTKEDFERDLENLLNTYKEVQALYKKRLDVGLVWQEDDVVTRTLRDTWTLDIEEIHIDDWDMFQTAQGFFRRTMPQHLNVIRHYTGKKPIFSKFQTEEQVERIYARRVPLPSGGAIVLDQTEALVAIDVNSGKTVGENQEYTALRTNMEAAEEIATQLRLRDLAGLIVIDFIDIKRETNNKAIMDRLVECLRLDKARMEVGKINRFGVLVMTRQRIRPSIHHVTYETCHVCQGTGQVKNSEALTLSVLRRLKSVFSRHSVAKIQLRLSPVIALNLLNKRRSELAELEATHDAAIVVTPDHTITYGEISMEVSNKEESPENTRKKEAPELKRDAEDETVILDGDAPISFHKALAQNTLGHQSRRDIQRAALDERERMKTLFEGTKQRADAVQENKEEKKKKKDVVEAQPKPKKKDKAEPPKLTAEVIASLAVPAIKAKKTLAETASPPPPESQTEKVLTNKTKAKANPKAKKSTAETRTAEVIASLAVPAIKAKKTLATLAETASPPPPEPQPEKVLAPETKAKATKKARKSDRPEPTASTKKTTKADSKKNVVEPITAEVTTSLAAPAIKSKKTPDTVAETASPPPPEPQTEKALATETKSKATPRAKKDHGSEPTASTKKATKTDSKKSTEKPAEPSVETVTAPKKASISTAKPKDVGAKASAASAKKPAKSAKGVGEKKPRTLAKTEPSDPATKKPSKK